MKQQNVIVAAWNLDQTSADFGDLNGDGCPDIAVVVPEGTGAVVKLFLNHKGKFAEEPDHVLAVPSVEDPTKLRVRELNGDGRLDLFVGGKTSALLLSRDKFPNFETTKLSLGEGNQARRVQLTETGQPDIVVDAKFGTFAKVDPHVGQSAQTLELLPKVSGAYVDLFSGDINGDGRSDLVFSYGQVLLRKADGTLPAEPTIKLPAAAHNDWSYFAVGDFNADMHPDLAFFTGPSDVSSAKLFYNTGNADVPFSLVPSTTFDLANPAGASQHPLLRDSVATADWNGDGVTDMVIGKGQDNSVLVLPGGPRGLDPARRTKIDLDYRIHYETGLYVSDFNGDGKPDLGCLGYTNTGVGAGGPLAVYIYLQEGSIP